MVLVLTTRESRNGRGNRKKCSVNRENGAVLSLELLMIFFALKCGRLYTYNRIAPRNRYMIKGKTMALTFLLIAYLPHEKSNKNTK